MNEAPRLRVASVAPPGRALNGTIAALALATAIIVTTEFIVVGLLPAMARDLGISLVEAGRFVTWFAFASAIGGPLLTIAASRAEPRRILVLAMLAFGFGNLVAALVPSAPAIVAVRVIQGAALPVFVSIGNAAVADLAGKGREGRAIAMVNIGVVIGIVLAMPAGIILADRSGWPASFAVLAALALIAAVIIGAIFPRLESARASMKVQVTILREPAFQAHLLLSALLFTAMFAAYTYLAAFLEAVAVSMAPAPPWR